MKMLSCSRELSPENGSNYDREREINESMIKQELEWRLLVHYEVAKIPYIFIHPSKYMPSLVLAATGVQLQVPMINLEGFDGNERTKIVDENHIEWDVRMSFYPYFQSGSSLKFVVIHLLYKKNREGKKGFWWNSIFILYYNIIFENIK